MKRLTMVLLLSACASSTQAHEPTASESTASESTASESTGSDEMVIPLESILLGDWQEDHTPGTTRTFVRGDRELGLARYRQRWSFRQDGTLSTRVLAENDAHYFVEGRWRVENSVLILEYSTRTGRAVREALQIVELSQQLLKIGR